MIEIVQNFFMGLGAIIAAIAAICVGFWLWDRDEVKAILFIALCIAIVSVVLFEIAMLGMWVRSLFP